MQNLYKLILLVFIVVGCNNNIRPVHYGQDICSQCNMHIIDQQHAAKIVNQYQKTFMFDSIECMMNYLKDKNANSYSKFLVNAFGYPSEFWDATQCTYIIYDQIPSPMGDYLTALKNINELSQFNINDIEQVLSWEELKNVYK
ncbi:MAG: hypothetical protein HOL62_03345 [Candidatus Marinimicrobia bacterium]|jgi:copper chaperone NosL|nr:hypothetical protein [Candidatus Neomarinimicrobiota bacterium]MBT3944765.1 hypothetical protein [Candidatus Neomarinimicrobiota bacterium]MBT4925917.1 hypothetical protein [Candidatus Neomarinimicrobiota bacterium]MBT5251721.1 hypothetical protein [Candidatus Neomarinimicrobiota bacterium]MBT5490135.1 hypothetical protein [Candidatus Neomarinimicrobiota bacterium]